MHYMVPHAADGSIALWSEQLANFFLCLAAFWCQSPYCMHMYPVGFTRRRRIWFFFLGGSSFYDNIIISLQLQINCLFQYVLLVPSLRGSACQFCRLPVLWVWHGTRENREGFLKFLNGMPFKTMSHHHPFRAWIQQGWLPPLISSNYVKVQSCLPTYL